VISIYSVSLPSTSSHAGSAAPSTFSSASSGPESSNPKQNLTPKKVIVRATAERLSQDLAGDPKHIYNHKYNRKAHLAGDPKRKV